MAWAVVQMGEWGECLAIMASRGHNGSPRDLGVPGARVAGRSDLQRWHLGGQLPTIQLPTIQLVDHTGVPWSILLAGVGCLCSGNLLVWGTGLFVGSSHTGGKLFPGHWAAPERSYSNLHGA